LALTVIMLLGDGDSLWPLLIFVGLSGFCEGIGGLVVSAKVADLFPASSLGRVMGIIEGSVMLAYMSGPLVGGVLFDRHGAYQAAFIMAMVLIASAAVLFWGVPLTSRRIQKCMSLQPWPEKGWSAPWHNRRLCGQVDRESVTRGKSRPRPRSMA